MYWQEEKYTALIFVYLSMGKDDFSHIECIYVWTCLKNLIYIYIKTKHLVWLKQYINIDITKLTKKIFSRQLLGPQRQNDTRKELSFLSANGKLRATGDLWDKWGNSGKKNTEETHNSQRPDTKHPPGNVMKWGKKCNIGQQIDEI